MNKLFNILSDKGSLIKAIENYKKDLKSKTSNIIDIKSYAKQIEQKELQIKNLIDQLSLNPNIFSLLSTRIEDLNNEIKELKYKKFELESTDNNLKQSLKEIDAATNMLLNFKKLWKNADCKLRRLLINSLINSIYYNCDTKEVLVNLFCTKKKRFLM